MTVSNTHWAGSEPQCLHRVECLYHARGKETTNQSWIHGSALFCFQPWLAVLVTKIVSHGSISSLPHISWVNTLRPWQNGRYFADDIFKCIFLNENARISLKISLKFVPKVWIDNIPALVQMMAWRRPGDEPLSAPRMVSLLMHICVTRPQWVNWHYTACFPHQSWSKFSQEIAQKQFVTRVQTLSYFLHNITNP